MSAIISVFLYLIILFSLSTLLFFFLVALVGTNEPLIVYLLSLIITHLILDTFGQIGKKDK